jgi:hypothetical protein
MPTRGVPAPPAGQPSGELGAFSNNVRGARRPSVGAGGRASLTLETRAP